MFIPRIFLRSIQGAQEEIDLFIKFVQKVIDLPRNKYLKVMSAIKNYVDGLQVADKNIDLAYSMMIYSIECLSQNFDKFTPVWDDYPDEVRGKLDKTFQKIPDTKVKHIKSALLKNSNLRLQKRFREFIIKHTNDKFYTEGALESNFAIRKSILDRAARNAYQIRSNYVHILGELQDCLKFSPTARGEIFYDGNEPYFTLAGLTRIYTKTKNY